MYKLTYLFALIATTSLHAQTIETSEDWRSQAKEFTAKLDTKKDINKKAKNLILFIGDGMSSATITATRIYDGQKKGMFGEENILSFERFAELGLSKTYNSNQQTPDSAGTATAIMTGVKTRAGMLSVGASNLRAKCTKKQEDLETIMEWAEKNGYATGVVTTTRITHATPASTYAHTPERDWEVDSKTPQDAIKNGCKDIARQLVEFDHGDGLDVVLGGGYSYFIPKEKGGKRKDKRDLVEQWQKKHSDGVFVTNRSELLAQAPKAKRMFGLFTPSHMSFDEARDPKKEPSIKEMTDAAIKILSRNKKGYVLMVEGGRIDHGNHLGIAKLAIGDTRAMAKAVGFARENTKKEETLIIVTSDHGHVLSLSGYPVRGNPILGKVVGNDKYGEKQKDYTRDLSGLPYTTLNYANGGGYMLGGKIEKSGFTGYKYKKKALARPDLTNVDTEALYYHQEAVIPLGMETHSGEDVAIYADGPRAYYFNSVMEQNLIFHAMKAALDKPEKSWWGF